MAERTHELLLRNLQEVFGEGDPAKRRSAIQELYTDDCVLYVPPGTFVGHDALDKFAGDLRATHPQFAYAPHAAPQTLHNSGRLKWGSGPRGGVPAYTGESARKRSQLFMFFLTLLSRKMKTSTKTHEGRVALVTGAAQGIGQAIIQQNILNGEGLAILDPHGDLVAQVLKEVPEHRKPDVIDFNVPTRNTLGVFVLSGF
jgi:hypothetical protein